ncbi:MAG: hypothetical protein RJA70_170 [Pseudomonadota bacterium]|jgi:serine/threonine-protein kinase
MGEVYLATSGGVGGIEGAERPVVVKIIRREHAEDKSFLARFFDEARIQAQLQHPGVAQVLEASTDKSGKPYVVLEHVEGRNLSDLRQRAAQLNVGLSWADAVGICILLAEALAHVHERTDASGNALLIVHRDLSPQNVMVGYAGDVKLIDFGTARGENRRCQTVSGIVFAKPGYVAPEVANQNQPGPQADIYALGIILWELVMGRRFLTGDPAEHLTRVAAGQRNPPAVSLTNNVPLELDTVIARLTAPRLQDRYQTAREALAALGRIIGRAPSLADGERSVRGRIAHLMSRLYPAEPAKTRAEFARLVAGARNLEPSKPALVPESPKAAPAETDRILPGTRYRLEREISKSALSVVYEAEHVDLGRRVALKVLPSEHCEDPKFEAQFRQEARALAQLRHSSLVTLHDFGVSQDGRPYSAMELLAGESLRARLSAGGVEWRRALRIAIDVCQALEVAHGRGLIHRDIKPANIFLTESGETKLIDFGIAQAASELTPDRESGALYLSGTPEYMAPEQMGPGKVDERADIYALASVVYEMLTGCLPFEGDSAVALLDAKQNHALKPASRAALDPSLPRALDHVLSKALSADPEHRPPSAAMFSFALQGCLHSRARARRQRRQLAVVGFAALTLGGTVFVYRNLDAAARGELLGSLPSWGTQGSWAESVGAAELEQAANAAPTDQLVGAPAIDVAPEGPSVNTDVAAAEPSSDELPSNAMAVGADRADEQGPSETTAPSETNEPSVAPLDEPSVAPLDEPTLTRLSAADKLSRAVSTRELALARFRELAGEFPNHPQILSGWSTAAARAKWWGESLRVALQWASVDEGADAQLHLAKTQRLVGQRYGAIQTLERLLQRVPDSPEATTMLVRYRER